MTTRLLLPFLIIAFGWGWSLVAVIPLFPDVIESLFGELSNRNPVFVLAVDSPAIAAIALVLWSGGPGALKRFLSRLLLWRAHWGWYLFLLVGIPVLFYAAALMRGTLFTDPFPFTSVAALLSALAFMLVLGPVEEIGWRGVAQPLLQRLMAPFWASVVLGMIWGVWHLPAFLLSGVPHSGWSFMPFFAAAIMISVIIAPLFNSSGGSILLPALLHWQLNNPIFPDAEPYDTLTFGVAAVVVVWVHRKTMFDRSSGVTTVIPK